MPEDKAQESFTAPDSRIMKHVHGGFEQSYNGQSAVDAEHAIVIGAELVQGGDAYRRRKHIVEPPNGWIKNVPGFRQFGLRGVEKVRAEWKVMNAALNLRRMACL